MVLYQRFLVHGDTLVNLALENRGICKWKFTTKVIAERGEKGPYSTKSTILYNFVNVRASKNLCPGALPAFFGAYGDTPVSAR